MLLRNGGARCWGSNATGQLGNGTTTSSLAPVVVSVVDRAIAIVTGFGFSCALRGSGQVLCWGSNMNGQLGRGNIGGNGVTPEPVTGL